MTGNAVEVDILNLRTTNINIRISPMLKLKIIESGARMGVNLSDYINYVITKSMTGQMDVEQTPPYKKLEEAYDRLEIVNDELAQKVTHRDNQNEILQKQLRAVQTELAKYQAVAEPYKDMLGKEVIIDGKVHRFEHLADALKNILSNFKIKN